MAGLASVGEAAVPMFGVMESPGGMEMVNTMRPIHRQVGQRQPTSVLTQQLRPPGSPSKAASWLRSGHIQVTWLVLHDSISMVATRNFGQCIG
jgi:hypothetical protein